MRTCAHAQRNHSLNGLSLSPNPNHRESLAKDPKVPRGASRVAAVASLASQAAQNPNLSLSLNGRHIMDGAGKSPNHGVHLRGLSLSPNRNPLASQARDRREASRAAAVASLASRAAQNPNLSLSLNGRHIMVGVGKSTSHGVHLRGLSLSPNLNYRASPANPANPGVSKCARRSIKF